MVRKIQHKRGPEKDLPRLEIAEWALTTDTEKPFIGAASGNVEIAKKKDLEAVSSEVSKKADATEVTALGSQLADKATKTEVTQAVEPKADKTYVDTELSKRPDKTYVDTKTQAAALAYKESYATLADLQTAYPTGDTFNHAVLADGMIYTWVNGAWTNTEIQANGTGIANNSIDPEKTTFLDINPQNLFNPAKATDGYRLDAYGELIVDANWSTSDFMPVSNGRTYRIFTGGTTTGRVIAYDSNGVFIKLISSGTSSGSNITVDWDGFIRIPVTIPSKPNTQFVDSSIYNGSFTPFSYITKNEVKVNTASFFPRSVSNELLAGDSVKSANIVEQAIDPGYHLKQVPLVLRSRPKNLFNKNAVTSDVYINYNNGAEAANTSYTASEFIPVHGGSSYTFAHRNQAAWYDVDRKFISGLPSTGETTVTAPDNAKFFRISTLKSNLDTQMIVEGTTLGEYEPHFTSIKLSAGEYMQPKSITSGLLADDVIDTLGGGLTSVESIARPILFNDGTPKKIKLLGDSRTHGSGGTGYAQDGDLIPGTDVRMNPNGYSWANNLRDLLARKYNVTVVNYGQSGKNSYQIYTQMTTLIEDDDDLILMMLGTNDRHNLASTEDTKQYQRAMIDYAHSKGIKVILMSAPPVTSTETTGDNDPIRNFGMFDLDKALQELAAEYNMQHISHYDNTLKFAEYRGISSDDLLADGLHENDAGHDVVFRHVLRSMGITYVREGVTK